MPRSRSSIDELLRPPARSWAVWALFGAACLALGIVALVADLDLAAFSTVCGIYLLMAGLLDAADGLAAESGDASRRASAIVLAVVAIAGGLVCLLHAGDELYVIVLATGLFLLVAGAAHVASGFDDALPRVEWALGGADVVIGGLILALPALTLGTFAPLFGIAILARGAAALLEARHWRSSARRSSVLRTPPSRG
jgi:uncharacterized membrane protein HdeD (DUF308 family)